MAFLQLSTTLGLTGVVTRATLLLVIGWCGALVLRRAPAGARHLVWLMVIAGVLLVAALARVAPVRVAVLPSVKAESTVPTPDAGRAANVPGSVPGMAGPSHDAGGPASHEDLLFSMPSYGSLAIGLWLGIAGALIGWLIVGMLSG